MVRTLCPKRASDRPSNRAVVVLPCPPDNERQAIVRTLDLPKQLPPILLKIVRLYLKKTIRPDVKTY